MGFAICVRSDLLPDSVRNGISPSFPEIASTLSSGLILVQDGTDHLTSLQISLKELMGDSVDFEKHIKVVGRDQDILEMILDEAASTEHGYIGFVGGITERVVAKKIGYDVLVDQPTVLADRSEVNVLLYHTPEPSKELAEIYYVLGEIEDLWDETVKIVHKDPMLMVKFTRFLDMQIRTQLGRETRKRLGSRPVFSTDDMANLFEKWLRFSRLDLPALKPTSP